MHLKIENLKHIKTLEFTLPDKGVWLLTGLNGSGKTSLLAALYRIKNSTAYQKYFRTSSLNNYDTFIDSKISYTISTETVTYKYSGERWRATPAKNSNLFDSFPYPTVKFIEVNAKRVEPSLHDLQAVPRSVRSVNHVTIDFMKTVLIDNKWSNLKFINYTRGIGNRAYIIPYTKGGVTHYYSEKNFSLGELCILRLACALENIQNNSLVLIDEVEIALHPKAQINLLRKLKDIASQKNLTIIFSTHSSTLIKSSDRSKILYLEQIGNTRKYSTMKNIYPAKILGEMAYDEELDLDYLFLVEDEQAKILLGQIIEKYKEIRSTTSTFTPLYRIIPIGGFKQVMDVLGSTSQIFKDLVKRKAFLDLDAQATINDPNQSYLQQFETLRQDIKFLPCTPEKGVIDLIHSDASFISTLNNSFSGSNLHIDHWITRQDYLNLVSSNNRDQAKKRMTHLVQKIHTQTGNDLIAIRKIIYRKYTDHFYSNTATLLHYLGPIFN